MAETVIGEGMRGVEYRARRDDVEHVALNIIHRELCEDDQILRLIKLEAQILKLLEAQHVVRIHDIIDEDGRLIYLL